MIAGYVDVNGVRNDRYSQFVRRYDLYAINKDRQSSLEVDDFCSGLPNLEMWMREMASFANSHDC